MEKIRVQQDYIIIDNQYPIALTHRPHLDGGYNNEADICFSWKGYTINDLGKNPIGDLAIVTIR